MSKFNINETPFTVYTPSDGGTPGEGLNASERASFRTEMEVPSLTELSAVETKADDAQADATQALSDAASAQSTADEACPDADALKTTGNQTKSSGVLTVTNAIQCTVPAQITGNGLVRMTEVESAISAAVPNPAWQSLSLINGWTGSAKYRVVGDYLEIWFQINSNAATGNAFCTLPSAAQPDYTFQYTIREAAYLSIIGASMYLYDYQVPEGYASTFKLIRLAP